MEVRRITINIAGRVYPLNVPRSRRNTAQSGKQIENMIKDFEQNFDVKR
ncbi:cell division protein ZapA [Chryseobacterium indoltheticum]